MQPVIHRPRGFRMLRGTSPRPSPPEAKATAAEETKEEEDEGGLNKTAGEVVATWGTIAGGVGWQPVRQGALARPRPSAAPELSPPSTSPPLSEVRFRLTTAVWRGN